MKIDLIPSRIAMSAAELKMGRLMRAPDDHVDPAPAPADPAPAPADPAPTDPAPMPDNPKSLLDDPDPADPADPADPKDPADPADPKDDPAEGAPEKYEAFKVGEGEMVIDQTILAEFEADFKERGLTQEQAQAEVNRGMKLAAHWQKSVVDKFIQTRKDWQAEVAKDPVIGGEKQPQVLAGAKEVLKTFGTDRTMKVFSDFGLGDHPGIIELLNNIRGQISDDVFIKGDKKGGPEKSPGAIMFPTMQKKD